MVAVSILSGVSGQRRQRSLFVQNNETVSGMGLAYLAEKWNYGGEKERHRRREQRVRGSWGETHGGLRKI